MIVECAGSMDLREVDEGPQRLKPGATFTVFSSGGDDDEGGGGHDPPPTIFPTSANPLTSVIFPRILPPLPESIHRTAMQGINGGGRVQWMR